MVKSLLLAATVALGIGGGVPRGADACGNEVQWTTNDYVRVVVAAEKQLEAGEASRAKRTLGRIRFPAALAERVADLKAVIALRTTQDAKQLEGARAQFVKRVETRPKDVRYQAWLAETHLALGARDEARAILVGLKERDLMPDAYAFHALAKLSTGTERYESYKACRTRAKNKEMCELPAEKAASR